MWKNNRRGLKVRNVYPLLERKHFRIEDENVDRANNLVQKTFNPSQSLFPV